MPALKRGKATFRPRARLLPILGEQLIANEVIAIVELVKNSYDADATEVKVSLSNVEDDKAGKIVVEDNGLGMYLDTILNVWLEPATDYRHKQKRRGERTTELGRLPLGEKGVGRFAAHKLGDAVELITRAKGSSTEIQVIVDWRRFERDVYLDEVPIYWRERPPQYFTGRRHGTRITVQKLRKKWNSRMVANLARKLQELNSPFAKELEFQVKLIAPGFEDILKDIRPLPELLEDAFYYFEGEVNKNGILTYTYRFNHPLSEQFFREVTSRDVDIKNPK